MTPELKAAAERRAKRIYDLGTVYGVPTDYTMRASDWDPTVKVVATAPSGQTLTIRVKARYRTDGKTWTDVDAWTTDPGAHQETFIKRSYIVGWYQQHATRILIPKRGESRD